MPTIVDTPNRGKAPIEVDEDTVAEFVAMLPDVPAGKGLRDDQVFKTESNATTYGRRLIKAIVAATGDTYLSANLDDNGERKVQLGLTVRQVNGEWTAAIRNWDR